MTGAQTATGRLPDFIIGGAPKCGTTSVHFILAQNPAIGMPDEEIHFFDADDPVAHPEFLRTVGGDLHWFDPRPEAAESLAWYRGHFARFADTPLIGEDSTTYLQSPAALPRIKAMLPGVRLIFLLRDPAKRAYSQYWHLVCSGRCTVGFERALIDHPLILAGSTYAPQLARYLDSFGRDRVHVALFEDFVADKQRFIDRTTDFIGAPRMDLAQADTWFNRTRFPSRPGAQLLLNRMGRHIVAGRYRNHMGQDDSARARRRAKLHWRWFRYVNPILLTRDRPPPMRPATRAYLIQHLSARNAGLSDLLGRPLGDVWPDFGG